MMRIGFHVPFAGSFTTLQKRLTINRGNTFQIFCRGLRGGKIKKIQPKNFEMFQYFLEQKNINPMILHAPFVYNLAQEETEDIKLVIEDLAYASKLRAPYYVIQPGYYKKEHPLQAVEYVKEHLLKILEETNWYGEILIRNMVGAGTELAADLRVWNELISFHPQIKGALDLGRAYGYGYNFAGEEGADYFFDEIEEMVSWEKIKVIYINDYERFCGTKKNYYQPLGEGMIGFHGFQEILSFQEVQSKIWIVENQPDLEYMDRSIEFLTSFFEEEG